MKQDKKRVHIISILIIVALIIALFVPVLTGRILGAIIFVPSVVVCILFIKKKNVLSINTKQIIMILSVMGVVYLTLYYLSVFKFGYTKTGYGLKWDIILRLIIPNLIIDSNDISASHSAHIGNISDELKFYVKSRGISEEALYEMFYKAILLGKMDFTIIDDSFIKIINEWW